MKRNPEEWLLLLSDESRADVMKVQIAEAEATNRERIKQKAETLQKFSTTDGFWAVRLVWAAAIVSAILGTTCVSYHVVDSSRTVNLTRIQLERDKERELIMRAERSERERNERNDHEDVNDDTKSK